MTMTTINVNDIFLNPVNQPMLQVNSSGPIAFQISLKRLGFANTFKIISINIHNKYIDLIKAISLITL